ncbi:hypothetical protein FHP25_34045 [Vineibacter terrae]|uniref:Uncharacterized protein n=1 Tax=Vineibacter terrae TaxID=2586908 RepID=A0A5C8PAF7_9HYPH|nr:hypothetical protein [Vineibacter terrae]TXL70558.1 hypothetical protein FHP25_34045 [Vineibacter terrae]
MLVVNRDRAAGGVRRGGEAVQPQAVVSDVDAPHLRTRMSMGCTIKGIVVGLSIAAGCIGGASAQPADASRFVGLWCSGTLHHLDSGSIELAIATVNDGVAFGTYAWRGPDPVGVSIQGNITAGTLKIVVDWTVSLDLALRGGELHGTFSNHRLGRKWDLTLARRDAC